MLNNSIIYFVITIYQNIIITTSGVHTAGRGVQPHPMVWKGVRHGIFFTIICIIDVQKLIC